MYPEYGLDVDEFNLVLIIFSATVVFFALIALILMYCTMSCGCCRRKEKRRKLSNIPQVMVTQHRDKWVFIAKIRPKIENLFCAKSRQIWCMALKYQATVIQNTRFHEIKKKTKTLKLGNRGNLEWGFWISPQF